MNTRAIIDSLIWAREMAGMSQKDVATKMVCTQSRVSKMESLPDDLIRLGDLKKHAEATGWKLRVSITSE